MNVIFDLGGVVLRWRPDEVIARISGDPRVRESFLKHHADFFDPAMWQSYKDRLLSGHIHDFYAYDASERFVNRYGTGAQGTAAEHPTEQVTTTLQRAAA